MSYNSTSAAANALLRGFRQSGGNIVPVRVSEFAIPGLSAAGMAVASGAIGGARSAADRLRQSGVKIPGKLPVPLNGVGLTIKRAWRLNKPAIKSAAVSGLTTAVLVGGTFYAVDKIKKRLRDDEQDRGGNRRAMSAKAVHEILFNTRTAAIHRVIDATRENLPEPEIPGREQVSTAIDVVKRSDRAHRAALRLAKVGAGALGGAYLGKKYLGPRRGLRAGAAAGAVAGLLFSTPEAIAPVRAGLTYAARMRTKIL